MKEFKRTFLSLFFIFAVALVVKAQDEEPIITFNTTLYADDGESNAFSLVMGATEEGVTVKIDCGFGKKTMEVGVAYIEGDSTLVGSTFNGSVSRKGVVKIYGDASKIDYFNASGCSITDITFSEDLNLKILNLEYNTLKSLNVDTMSKLQALYLTDNAFTKDTPLNLGYLPNLTILDIHQVGYVSPDFNLKNFPNLVSLDAYHCLSLKTADPSGCPNLARLSLDMTAVESLDLSNSSKLQILNVSDTKVTSLDLSQCPHLNQFYCSHASGTVNTEYRFSSLDVTNNPELYVLFCGGNGLTSIDLSQNPILFDLSAPGNDLTSIDLSNCPELYNVNLGNNRMDFGSLPLPRDTWGDYQYNQKDLVLNDTYKVGDVIDLSKNVLREGTTTYVTLYTAPKDNPTDWQELGTDYYTYKDGKITLLKPCDTQVFFAFSNNVFSLYDLYTERFRIRSEEDFGKDVEAFSFASGTMVNGAMEMAIGVVGASEENPVTVSVDFGDGNPLPFTVTEEIPSANNIVGTRLGKNRIRVYTPQDNYVSALATDGLSISNITLSELTDLRVLSLRNAGLRGIDLSYNANLEALDLSGNLLSSLALGGPSYFFYKGSLHNINLSNNQLVELTFDDLYAAHNLNLSNNQLTSIDVSDADNLVNADFSGNAFTELLFTNSDSLRVLNVANNNLTYVYVPVDAPLSSFDITGNKFTLPEISELLTDYKATNDITYAPQQPIQIALKSPTIDLSSQYIYSSGYATSYVWRKADGTQLKQDVEYTIDHGLTKFLDASVGDVYCEMSHNLFPQFTGDNILKTTLVTPITVPTIELASFTTTEEGNDVELSLAAENDRTCVYFDWEGDGNVTAYELTTTYTRFAATTKKDARVRVLVADESDRLSVFSITGAHMKDVDLSGLTKTFAITLADAGLTKFTLPKSNSLGELNLSNNNLSSIDLSLYPNLYYLSLNGNNFTTIDLSKVEGLGLAYLGNNKLSSITLNNPNLWNLDLAVNNFSDISFDGAPNIEQLWMTSNNLTEIDVNGLKSLKVLNLVGNRFRFSTLPAQKDSWYSYSYGKQQDVEIADNQSVIDLSSEAEVDGITTTYRWFVGKPTIDSETEELVGDELSEGSDFSIDNGVTTFSIARTTSDIVGVMTNENFPNLTLYTKPVTVISTDIDSITATGNTIDAVYAIDGTLVARGITSLRSLAPGIYIVTSAGKTRRVVIK